MSLPLLLLSLKIFDQPNNNTTLFIYVLVDAKYSQSIADSAMAKNFVNSLLPQSAGTDRVTLRLKATTDFLTVACIRIFLGAFIGRGIRGRELSVVARLLGLPAQP